MAVQAPTSLDDALLRALYFAVHEEEIADLIEQYNTNKKNDSVNKRPPSLKEPATRSQLSFAIRKTRPIIHRPPSILTSIAPFTNENDIPPRSVKLYFGTKTRKRRITRTPKKKETPITIYGYSKLKSTSNKRGRVRERIAELTSFSLQKKVDIILWGNATITETNNESSYVTSAAELQNDQAARIIIT